MSNRKTSAQPNYLFLREMDIEVCLKTLKIYQKIEGDVSCVVQDASLVLAKYLEKMCQHKPDFLSGVKILELRSGLGVVGLTAATLGAQVTLTDATEALLLLQMNLNENKAKISSMGGYAVAESLVWGNSSSLLDEEFDIVLLANCIDNEEAFDPLIITLKALTNTITKRPVIYVTQELRDTRAHKALWNLCYEKLTDIFYVEMIPQGEQHSNYKSTDIILLRLKKKM